MESKPASKVPVIFGKIEESVLHKILENNDAKKKETKAVFLIREDKNFQGLMTVSYYSQEQDMVKNLRFGLTNEGWKRVPKPPKEPSFTATLEVKTKYIRDKEKFDKEMQSFIKTAKTLFEQKATPEQIKMLSLELKKEEYGFDLSRLIRPSHTQVSKEKHFLGYVGDAFITEDTPHLTNINKNLGSNLT
ncbi:Uncharacterised protein [Legionella steigerwaltii]|uniref:Uncharacterized protein n=1 Tax=Legionella steigerwaltii TaxID=460 RepID=A0A378LAE9_9GAMM|nr:hypothetical protein [Legionella steigerwaltii]KTD81012.1 hypothetical protein Lstg_0239 [Legionella steigerwaltii]STY23300.1 Uncharacterised protein [Legionella steigerwaltii]